MDGWMDGWINIHDEYIYTQTQWDTKKKNK